MKVGHFLGVHLPNQANHLGSLIWVVYAQCLDQGVYLSHLDALRAYLTPDTTSAQIAESIVVFDAVASERRSPYVSRVR